MTIETKYKIGDEVWWYWIGSCMPATGVIIAFWRKGDICYAQIVNKEMPVNIEVNRLYPTKEELLKSL